jgi:nitrogen regulatory protein P-II 1
MYLITAIFNKTYLKDVLQGLYEKKIEGITIADVLGKGLFGFVESEEKVALDEKVRVDIVVSNDTYKEDAMEAIRSNAQELSHGSGKMWVTEVLEVERIRTGEKNEAALSKGKDTCDTHLYDNYFTAEDTPAS